MTRWKFLLVDYLIKKEGDELEGLSLPLHSTTDKGVILSDGTSLKFYPYDAVEEDLKERCTT